ncbi:YbaY family lipoprotein [Oceanomicrobium pacificus]|uniref:META domain-containing protein n=1 Tax=Oceanomicrobium pacificus TaxID=2692916 RepID=A0A6B0U083_9RHOB|nr:YbaY family lipoprotein [Oceanomicrobium pacificus]MXU64551.1 META domain-containing protein [Oceanomicrobium pacificus]
MAAPTAILADWPGTDTGAKMEEMQMKRISNLLRGACIALAGLGATAVPALAEMSEITGSAAYRERIALPPESLLRVELRDVSKADAPSTLIAAQTVYTDGRVPIAFKLPYDTRLINDRHSYAVSATLSHDGQVLFRTDTVYPVITRDAGEEVDLLLVKASAPAPETDAAAGSAADFAGTWLAEDLMGQGVIDNLQSTLEIQADGTVGGLAGCNRFRGDVDIEGATFRAGPMALTQKACIPAVGEQEQRFMKVLGAANRIVMDGPYMKLLAPNGTEIGRFTKMN